MSATPTLEDEVSSFVADLVETVNGVLPEQHEFETNVGPPGRDQRITVAQQDEVGIPLLAQGQVMFRLRIRYRCTWNSDQQFFAINQSAFIVSVDDVPEPLMHFDYNREGPDDIPVAHINIHAHRDELMYALMMASGLRAKHRDAAMKRGRIPRVSALHIPIGGHRFRPPIEDVLDMMIVEFGIDHQPDARAVLAAGRAKFRSIQVSASVSDDAEMAAGALRRMGYEVTPPASPPTAKTHRLSRY